MSIEHITFSLQKTAADYRTSIEFAHKIAYHWYQCCPSETPQYLYAARARQQVVSTVGVTHYQQDNLLPLCYLYQLDSDALPKDWDWRFVSQLSWFFSIKKGCFIRLLLMALIACHEAK